MSQPIRTITHFVLEKIEGQSLHRQAELYRALSELTGIAAERKLFRQLADELHNADLKQQELHLHLGEGNGEIDGSDGQS